MFSAPVTGMTLNSLSLTHNSVGVPLTGATLSTNDGITYTLGNLISLDAAEGSYTLRFTAAGSNVAASAGHVVLSDASTAFTVAVPPQITALYVRGSVWQPAFMNYLAAHGLGDAQLGYQLMGGANQLKSLPWTNINIISVVFSTDVNIASTAAQLLSSPDLPAFPAIAAASFSYSSAMCTAQWIYGSTALTLNNYLLNISAAAVTSKSSGAQLDGEWTNASGSTPGGTFPSGNGVAGGDFNFRFNVLPGDVEQAGTVSTQEAADIASHFGQFTTQTGYSPFMDTAAKGRISGLDLLLVQANLGATLPSEDILPPANPTNRPVWCFARDKSWDWSRVGFLRCFGHTRSCAMQKKYIVRLSDAEREVLKKLVKKLKSTSQGVRHAQVLLKADADGPTWQSEHAHERRILRGVPASPRPATRPTD